MAAPQFNSKSPTFRRILREAKELTTSPSPDYHAAPLEADIFEWHFTLRGPPNSPFEGGIYHGRIVLPPSYPLRPPSFRFLTPSGRFETNREICLSISGHHEETWQPAWGVRTALVALRSFMETDVKGQLGGLEASEEVRRQLARESAAWQCNGCGGRTNGEIMSECEERVKEMGGAAGKAEEEKVPEELKMGWKDEMEANKDKKKDEFDEESAKLAEGFVQTAPVAAAAASGPSGDGAMTAASTVMTETRPAPAPAPAPSNSMRAAAGPALQQRAADRRASNEDAWLDRLIVAVAILLAAIVAKVMLA
ncbi:Ubiquitin-conjugating enzyme E2 J1 [Madurella mycetomatis]|uniref:Ubiquitin-conjugating enzyme E2 J1 n=1 Tax=Madurella mycetomatis TaxID=100816 RepID=A0A175W4M1_9PEZI|nr:Ubiquitin-conjugating enzyme E2 J1 [Madurella mycetomatis]